MNAAQLLKDLLGARESFERVLGQVREVDAGELLIGFVGGLDSEQSLDNAERERRLRAVFSRTRLETADLRSIADAGAKATNIVLRNALALLLPAEFRNGVFRPQKALSVDAPEIQVGASEHLDDNVDTQLPSFSRENTVYSDVVILSIADDPPTKKLLESNGFVPLRCSSMEEFDGLTATNDRICAFLVESSFLSSLGSGRQSELITKLALFSTLVWIRFQDDGLIASVVKVLEDIAGARCQTSNPTATEVSFQDTPGLREKELEYLFAAKKRLSDGDSHGRFIPGELNERELKLLGAAMSQYSKKKRFNPGAELTQVKTSFLQGGRTNAKVALVKVNDLRLPVIVKIDKQLAILSEARRFLTLIHKDDPDLRPEVHLHADAALIVFGIVSDQKPEAEAPAPTLEQSLIEQWNQEMEDPASFSASEVLLQGFSDGVRRLAILNRQKYSSNGFLCFANPYIVGIKTMEEKGFDWGFGQTAIAKRDWAEGVPANPAEIAVCHGDAHTRNVLIRGDRGFLIDYAYTGPGHPCTDLVRLELSVYLTRFVPFGSEADLRALQRDISIERLSISELLSKHGGLIRSKTNELCLRMCIVARDQVGDVLKVHNLPWDHYVAVKILAAWQALHVPSLQQSLVRGVISAIGTS